MSPEDGRPTEAFAAGRVDEEHPNIVEVQTETMRHERNITAPVIRLLKREEPNFIDAKGKARD